ncbi:NAD-dependent epimerase/dehydratase family protein [Bacteroides sp. 51]|uniref:NAD-dependent epimerase/dehydratase family protein n=1 Tax=Bacteroides sp. 51 TaxID=2302938 RepID=UPI0013D014BF|nr:NAD-dependent epimerase/dehydratase family protein [Bacteroides sp. 51]NDV83302.1 NAD-dependent epimerase/dehydratase family protein [Bacteroides sp. 51]
MKLLITGAAGFIGYHIVRDLIQREGMQIIGLDNINNYYDVNLKYDRLAECGINRNSIIDKASCKSAIFPNYTFYKADIADSETLNRIFGKEKIDVVIHMAAQAGVRYSIENPHAYVLSNLVGFANVLECCRHHKIKHLVYASSSSIYGQNNEEPFRESDNVDYPVSFYAATKKSNELMAHTYSHLYQLPTTGVRLFTVYGPWGRPDMAPMLFADSIKKGKGIHVFNHGNMLRDFTYVEDIVKGIVLLLERMPDAKTEHPFYQIYNIGNSAPVKLMDFIQTMEGAMGKKAILEMLPMQPGDVTTTYADTTKLMHDTGYKPATKLTEGIAKFVEWYNSYFNRPTQFFVFFDEQTAI